MTKRIFSLRSWKKIVIHEFSVEPFANVAKNLTATIPMGGRADPLRWCNGFLLLVNGFPPSPEILQKELRGELHWRYAGLSPWPKFSDIIELGGKITVPVLDVSSHPIYQGFVEWAKENFWEDISAAESTLQLTQTEKRWKIE